MRTTERLVPLVLTLALVGAAPSALAGAPLIVDPVTGKPWVYPPGETVPVFTDLGNYGVVLDRSHSPATTVTFDNAVGVGQVRTGLREWSSVPTTALRTEVVGDFSQLGLPDITGANANLVIGVFNGGGIDVIFDADGSVLQHFLGVGPSVLGISTPEFGDEKTGYITESWTVLNGHAIAAADPGAAHFQGTATHELGHAFGLAHTQTNGAAYFYAQLLGASLGPTSCTKLPYPANLSPADVETMYPFQNPSPSQDVGIGQGHVHTTDDRAAISDLYPGKGWPAAYGTISGKVLDVDGKTPLTGVNVIARNLDDPFADANSALSSEWTQGLFGPDGTFTLHGLRPGARYVVYVEAVVAGGFPTPPLWFLPGAERFYNGPSEHDEDDDSARFFDPCAYEVLRPRAGRNVRADIAFERVRGAPVLISLGYQAIASGISGDGKTVVGNYGVGAPPFRWTEATGVVPMDVATTGEVTTISRNGKYIATNLESAVTHSSLGAFRWDEASGWIPVDPVGKCGTDTTSAYGVANDGTVYGVAYNSCKDYKTFGWNPTSGTKLFPSATLVNGKPANGRPNRVSADGSTLVGWEGNSRVAVAWVHGVPMQILDEKGQPVNEATAVSGDGQVIGGARFEDGQANSGYGWRTRLGQNGLDYFGPVVPSDSRIRPFALSRDGRVMAGFSGDAAWDVNAGPFIWTKELGTADLNQFLHKQGTAFEQFLSLWTPYDMSDSGSVMTGNGLGRTNYAGWVLKMPRVFVCHLERDEHGRGHTRSVEFPDDFDRHLAHGDTDGPCPGHQE